MNTNMNVPPPGGQGQTIIVNQVPPPGNSMGVAGFVLALVGLLSCGTLSIFGLLFSTIGLFKEPRGLAVAGFILSLLPVLGWLVYLLFFVGLGVIVGLVGLTA